MLKKDDSELLRVNPFFVEEAAESVKSKRWRGALLTMTSRLDSPTAMKATKKFSPGGTSIYVLHKSTLAEYRTIHFRDGIP